MKRLISFMTVIILFTLLVGGCGTLENGSNVNSGSNDSIDHNDNISGNDTIGNNDTIDSNDNKDNSDSNVNSGEADNNAGSGDSNEAVSFQAEIIETGDTLLVAPDQESNEAKSSDKISVNLLNAKYKDVSGLEITKGALKSGDLIKIYYSGIIMESYPAQISADVIEVTGHNLLIDGYLTIIDDIYQEDSGLNYGIEMIALDTTDWTELTAIEKEMIFTEMKNRYGVEIIKGTYDSLAADGLIDKDNLYFEKGILIDVFDLKYDKDNAVITYSISKWKSGLGAVGADDVTAEYDGSTWKITKESMWIS